MDVGHLRTPARSGSDFLKYGTGDVRVKSLGDQDEDVDIDDGDTGGTPPAAGVSGAATGVGTPSKSVAGSTPAPRVGVVSSTSSERRREQHAAGSQASNGRRPVPQLFAGEDGSSKYSDASVPKVSVEGTSKQSDFQKRMSAKSSGRRVRQLAVMQQQSKRKASETEPSTSAPAKRTRLHDVISDSSDKTGHDNRADESNVALSMRREDSPLKRKEILQDGGEGREKSLPVTVRGKRPRVLRLNDDSDSDEELFERIVAINDGVRNPPVPSALRSAFPLNAKRKVHPPVPHTEAALATENGDKHRFWQWITCTKCKKIRLVNADEDLDVSSWCCEKNTRNPLYASCSAPQEKRAHCEVEGRQASIIELDASEDVPEAPDYVNELERKKKAQRKMVWVKLQVDGKHVWWPGLTVKVVPAAIQKIIDETADGSRAVRLFHPPRDLEEYQVVRKSSLKPFEVFFLSYRNSSSHPDFKVAVTEADQYFMEPDMEELSEFSTASKSETRLNAAGDIAKCLRDDVPHEHAESNELEVEDAEMPGDDCHAEADDEKELVEDGEVNQALVENGVAKEPRDAGHGDAPNLKEDDPHCSPSQGDQMENGMADARLVYCSTVAASEPRNDRASPEAISELNVTDKKEDALTSVAIEVERTTEVHMDVKPSETVEASFRSKASEGGGTDELCVYTPGEKLVLDLEISPTKRLIEYDDATKELHFQDGIAVSIDAVSLGKEFNKCSTGPTLHECIYEVGKANIRRRFPTRSSTGLKFGSLDQDGDFAKRLRDTWLREYPGEPMPEYLTSRFVAGCILEERGKSVNWAYELTRSVRNELKQIRMKTVESFSPSVLKLIGRLLEKNFDPAPVSGIPQPNSEAVEDEEPLDFSGYENRCHRCKETGVLLCCDGPGCPKTYHLTCLNPPLKAVPTTAFICPVCLVKNIALPDVEAVTSSALMNGIELPTDHGSREELQGVAESSTFVGDIDALDPPVNEDSVPNLEVSKVTMGAVGELGDTHVRTSAVCEEVDLLEENRTIDAAHLQSNTTAHGSEHADPENVNGVGDRCVSPTYPDATAGEESQISGLPSLGDSFQVENCVHSRFPVELGDSIQAEKCVHSRYPVESDLEEGEFLPSEQVNVVGNTAALDTSAPKLPISSTPPLTQEVLARVEPPYEEDEFPSSDDHNNFCEGCEVGGELMYVTTPSFASTPSSSFLLCDGKGCRVVYHKECLNPPLETIPAGEWFCPKCEKRKVERIWSVRNVDETSKLRRSASSRTSDASSPESYSEDDAQEDAPLAIRFKSSSQRPDGEVAGLASGRRAGVAIRSLKDDGVEYLVQWKSRSHAHDEWVSEKELEKLAPKELARFKKSLQQGPVKYDSEWAEPERVLQKRFATVTRRQPDASSGNENILNHQKAEIEWFVKWKGLEYEFCTWEPAGVLATPRGIEVINAYERWADAAKQRASPEGREEAERLVKSPFRGFTCQPEWMIRPEQEQLDALNKLLKLWHSRLNGILIYEASQEKIALTIMFFLSLVENYRVVHPILVVVPKSLIQNWKHELSQWAPKLYIVNYASKTEEARDIIRRAEFSSFSEPFRPQIVLTSFDVINCDMDHLKKVEWEVLIVDEGRTQRVQKSCQKFYRIFSQIRSIFRLLLLSEPLKSNVEELVQFVNFLEPRKSVFPHGDESIQVAELRRRLAGRVLEYIPKNRLTEYWVPVEMTPTHLDQYYHILVNHYPTLSRNHRDHQIQEVVTKLRQSCNHPFLADPSFEQRTGQGLTPKELLDHHIDISGKMRLLHLMMPILKSAGLRVLIFSQETRQLDILERYMTQSHGSDSYERLDTDIAVNVKEAAIQRFNAEGSKRFVFLLKTGIHVSFRNVQFVLIYDSDWNPENDMRALHKIHNEGEARCKPLPVLRFYTHLTVEEATLALSRDEKLPSTRAGFSAKICQKLLTWGASKIFDHFDNRQYPAGSSLYRPKGAKICPKAKLKQVVYDLDSISTLFKALLSQEESLKIEGDELLEAVLVPRDEPAPLFAESDHPITMITGESARAFWASSLKWRHDDWQAKKVNNLGKGQRGKKRITYDEDAMASAVFEKTHPEENDKRRPKRRKVSGEEDQEGATGSSNPVSFQQRLPPLSNSLPSEGELPSASTGVDRALPSVIYLPGSPTQVETVSPPNSTLPESPKGTALPAVIYLPGSSTQVETVSPPGSTLPESPTPVETALPSVIILPGSSTQVETVLPPDSTLPDTSTPVETALPSVIILPGSSTQVETVSPLDSNMLVMSTHVETALPSGSNLPEPPTQVETVSPPDSSLPEAPTPVETALPSEIILPGSSTQVETVSPLDSTLLEIPTPVETALPSVVVLPRSSTQVETVSPLDSNMPVMSTHVETALPSGGNLPEPSTQVETVSPLDSNMPETSTHVETAMPSDSNLAEASTEVDTALPSDRGQLQEVTDASQEQLSEVPSSASGSINHHESTQSAGPEQVLPAAHIPVASFMMYLQTISSDLDLPEAVYVRVQELFRYFLHINKKLHRPRPPHEIFALQLCTVWFAAEEMGHEIDRLSSLHMVEEKYAVSYGTEEDRTNTIMKKLYGTVVSKLKSCTPGVWSAPPAGVPTTPQPPSVPESISGVPDQPSRAETEVSPQNVHPEAINTEEPEGTGSQVEAEVPLPVSEAVPEGSAPAGEAAEPVVAEADAEVVFVEADHRLVPEDSFNEFLTVNPVSVLAPLPVPVSSSRRVSGDSEVSQGLGWVIVDSPPMVEPVEEPFLPEATGSEPALSPPVNSLSSSQVGTATPVDASPLTRPAEVAATESTRAANRTPGPVERAKVTKRLHDDKTYVIYVQKQEMSLLNTEFERKADERKRQYDDRRRRPATDPEMLEVLEVEYKKDMLAIQRQKIQDKKLLDARQRADRDKLNEVYMKLISMASGQQSGLDVPSLELEVQKIKDYYRDFVRTSLDSRLPQGPVSSRPSTSPSAQVSAENQQRQHAVRVASAASPQQGRTVQVPPQNQRSSASMQPSREQPAAGQGVPHSQRPPVISTAQVQPSIVHGLASLRSQRPPVISTSQMQAGIVQPVTSPRPPVMSLTTQPTIVAGHSQRPAVISTATQSSPVTGIPLPHSPRPAVISTAPMQPSNVQPVTGHSQLPSMMSTAPAPQSGIVQPVTGHSQRPSMILTAPAPQSTIVQPVTGSQYIQRPTAPAQPSIVHSVPGQGLPHSQRPPVLSTVQSNVQSPVTGLPSPHSQRPAVVSTAPVTGLPLPHSPRPAATQQPSSVQTRVQAQTAIPTPAPNVQRGAAAVSRSVPAGFGTVPPHQGPDVFVKEKEKLSKQLEKAKLAYDSESQAIKAGYDKEAEILHKKYEGLLVERHRVYTKEQAQTQQALQKVEYNRQLAEALRFREELAARAAIFAGIQASQAASQVQPVVNHQATQAPQGRIRTGTAPVPPNLSRGTTNTVSGATMQNIGTPSTPSSVPPRFGIPAAPPGEQSRSSMLEAFSVLAANRNAVNPGINAVETSQPHGVSAPMSPEYEDPILAIIRGSAAPYEENPSPPLETAEASHPQAAGIAEPVIEGAPRVQLPGHISTATVVPALERLPNFINLSDSDDE